MIESDEKDTEAGGNAFAIPEPDYPQIDGDEPMYGEEQLDPVLVLRFQKMGYSDLRKIPRFGVCGISRFLFTVGVCYGMNETGMRGRFCFDTYQNAQLFLKDWNGSTLPVVGEDGCTAVK